MFERQMFERLEYSHALNFFKINLPHLLLSSALGLKGKCFPRGNETILLHF